MSSPTCPACGSDHLAPITDVEASSYRVHASFLDDTGFLPKQVNVRLTARICGQCGHASMFATPQGLEELRAKWSIVQER